MAVNNLNTPGTGIQPTLIDAKGDLLVGVSNDTINRLGVTGTTGAVLTADAGETTGLKWAAAGSVGGLVHIETQTFSAVSAVNFNNVFTSTYSNYRIIGNINNSAAGGLSLRFRLSGSDFTGANYDRYGIQVGGTSILSRINVINSTSAFITDTSGATNCFMTGDVIGPNLPVRTFMTMNNFDESIRDIRTWTISHSPTTQYDGFSVLTDTGTITGAISVYGYKL
jgi:hypothetical protein